jgi:hypothetical protein
MKPIQGTIAEYGSERRVNPADYPTPDYPVKLPRTPAPHHVGETAWFTDPELAKQERTADDGTVRTFATGATRDTAEGKTVPWRYGSAVVDHLFASYMQGHQKQSDGQLRAGDNWKKGFGIDVLDDCLSRHIQDYRLHAEGHPELAREADIIQVLLAVKFNVDALILEHWTADQKAGEKEC